MTARDDKKVALPEPDYWEVGGELFETESLAIESIMQWGPSGSIAKTLYTPGKLESYAAARVAEATAELRTKLADAEASDAESMALYRSARARADELQRRVAGLWANDRRYRWLRKNCTSGRMEDASGLFELNCDEPESEWDAAIDAILADREGGKA